MVGHERAPYAKKYASIIHNITSSLAAVVMNSRSHNFYKVKKEIYNHNNIHSFHTFTVGRFIRLVVCCRLVDKDNCRQ